MKGNPAPIALALPSPHPTEKVIAFIRAEWPFLLVGAAAVGVLGWWAASWLGRGTIAKAAAALAA
jgi:hypothetical protein